jgi:hypothetical protein
VQVEEKRKELELKSEREMAPTGVERPSAVSLCRGVARLRDCPFSIGLPHSISLITVILQHSIGINECNVG